MTDVCLSVTVSSLNRALLRVPTYDSCSGALSKGAHCLWPHNGQTRVLTEAFLITAKYSVVMLLIGPEDQGGTGVCSPLHYN